MWLRVVLDRVRGLLGSIAAQASLARKYPDCRFYEGAYLDAQSDLDGCNAIFQHTKICNASLGRHTYVQKYSNINNASIGSFCSIGPNVNIGLGQHPVDQVSTHPAFYSITQPIARSFADADHFDPLKKRTHIGHDVWIGHSALVLDGVRIGDGAVIGANAVVTKDVPAYAIVAGVPARMIRYRFDAEVCISLEQMQWWNRPDEWLQQHWSRFTDPRKLLELQQQDKPPS